MHRSDLQVFGIHTEALFAHDPDGRIRSNNEPDGAPAPRFYLGRTREGTLWRFRHDVPEDVARRLESLAASEPVRDDLQTVPRNLAAFQEALSNPPEEPPAYAGPAYRFPDDLPMPSTMTRLKRSNLDLLRSMPAYHRDIVQTFEVREPVCVVIEAGVAVSLCFSSRLTDRAAEAGAETLEAYRGRGYAAAVVAAWALGVRATGRIPLYGTTWQNLASQGVARRLGLILYGADVSLK